VSVGSEASLLIGPACVAPFKKSLRSSYAVPCAESEKSLTFD
jgi:hypothetical protein